MANKPPAPPVPKPKPKKKEKTPAEVARRQDAIRRERNKLYTPREKAQASVQLAKEKERITRAEFNRQWGYYNDIYNAYAGRNASRKEAFALIRNGITATTLAKHLAKQPAFFKSPVWKQQADKYYGPARNMGMKVDKKFVAQAIANNWDPYVFQEKLRQRPGYLKSNEFRTVEAGMKNAYTALYGEPDAEWGQVIKRAALARWTEDQWRSYLRQQPGYRNSTEYQETMSSVRSLLGFTSPLQNEAPIAGRNPQKPPKDRRVPY